jgi:hypothetical protein
LINIGFTGGIYDFELCHYDVEVMFDWFYLRRSFPPQSLCQQLVNDWVAALFATDGSDGPHEVKSVTGIRPKSESVSEKRPSLSGLVGDATPPIGIPHQKSDSVLSMSMDRSHGPTSQSPHHGSHAGLGVHGGHGLTSAGMAFKNFSLPQVQKNFTGRLIRMLPFCLGKQAALDILAEEELDAAEQSMMDTSPGVISPMMSMIVPNIIPQKLRTRLLSFNSANLSTTDYYGLVRSTFMHSGRREELYTGVDEPPPSIRDVMEIYFPSKMQQFMILDLHSLRSELVLSKHPRNMHLNDIDLREEDIVRLPTPHSFICFYFPPCVYSFDRIRRVLESKIETLRGQRKFALAFRDDSFAAAGMRDFHGFLLQFLFRCPEVHCVSFSCHGILHGTNVVQSTAEDSAYLGSLAGSIPPSIRFLNFRGVLSSESLQAICILLKKQNVAFSLSQNYASEDNDFSKPSDSGSISGILWRPRSKGLWGLAITHTVFNNTDISYILELLSMYTSPYPPKTHGHSHSSSRRTSRAESPTTPDTSHEGSVASSVHSANSSSGHHAFVPSINFTITKTVFEDPDPRGLRYLDLSSNRMADASCAEILQMSTCGPLEGLELGDNYIHKGAQFLDTFSRVIAHAPLSFLRHLGLSNNMMTAKLICSMMDTLHHNMTLTSLDISNNEFQHSTQAKESLRSFLKKNKGMRILDLSYNKLTAETTKHIFLGLLENDTMLMLNLSHNAGAANATEFPLVQDKLFDNRKRYKTSVETFNKDYKAIVRAMKPDQSPVSSGRAAGAGSFGGDADRKNAAVGAAGQPTHAGNEESKSADDILAAKRRYAQKINAATAGAGISFTDAADTDSLDTATHSDIPVAVPIMDNLSLSLPVADAKSEGADLNDGEKSHMANVVSVSAAAENGSNNGDSTVATNVSSARAPAFVPGLPPLGNISSAASNSSSAGSSESARGSSTSTLNVFFSAPLAWRDRANRLHPLEVLDYSNERDALVQVLREVNRDISVVYEFATTDTLRTALSFGCRALHFSGHGHPQCVSYLLIFLVSVFAFTG